MQGPFSFRNTDEWREQVHRVPWGIPEDQWRRDSFTVSSIMSGLADIEYATYYRDVLSVVRFLLGHTPFKHNLVYASVQLRMPDNTRVYNKMHTEDWWWQTQDKLPEGATIVPILIAKDKTQLTNHHGDLSLWPVYMTIGNLDRATRQSQKRPGLILVGSIPIVKVGKEHRKHLQAQVYHFAMETIFKRM